MLMQSQLQEVLEQARELQSWPQGILESLFWNLAEATHLFWTARCVQGHTFRLLYDSHVIKTNRSRRITKYFVAAGHNYGCILKKQTNWIGLINESVHTSDDVDIGDIEAVGRDFVVIKRG
jgi:hypothetical protein